MTAILSIDFDYFIDASSQERDLYFPAGSDEIAGDMLSYIWNEKYRKYPELKKLGVIKEYYFLKNYLASLNMPRDHFIRADSHKYIIKLIEQIPEKAGLTIVNIDFHHDYYHYYKGKEKLNCGNWLRRLIEERPDTKVKWIRRKDSQIYSLEGEFPFKHNDDIKSISNENYDYVFLCRSPEWSPPHLKNKFEELAFVTLASAS